MEKIENNKFSLSLENGRYAFLTLPTDLRYKEWLKIEKVVQSTIIDIPKHASDY